MKVEIRAINEEEAHPYGGLNAEVLTDRKAVVFTDDDGHTGILFMKNDEIEMMGEEYIATHSKLEYSRFCEEWFATVSQNDYRNDPARNPPKTIDVRFVEMMNGVYAEIWREADGGRYFMRQRFNEPFARWLTCYKTQYGWEDGACIRPNITFRHGQQTETTRYDDWNGSAVYSDSFNQNFLEGTE